MRSCDAARTSVCRPSCGTLDSSDSSARSTARGVGTRHGWQKVGVPKPPLLLQTISLTSARFVRLTLTGRSSGSEGRPPFEYPWKETGTA